MSKREQGLVEWLEKRLNLTEIFSLFTSYGLFIAELDSRKPLRRALDEALDQPVASYVRWPRVLGLVVVVLLSLEVLTGALLALYYLPTPESAHASLGTILRDVDFGWFIHQAHFWGAQLLVAVLLIRVVRFFIGGVYRRPRELVWVFGTVLLLVCLHLDLTGRVLPFTTASYWATVRAIEVVETVPLYGAVVSFLLGGGGGLISELTLIRFYTLHVAILPMAAVVLIYLHFSSVRRIGLSAPGGESDESKRPARLVLGEHLVQLVILLALLVGLLVTLAVLAPLPFQAEADPFATEPGVGPAWYLLAPFGFLEWIAGLGLPRALGGAILLAAFVVFVALPWLDRSDRRGRPGPLLMLLGGAILLAWLFFTWYGARVA